MSHRTPPQEDELGAVRSVLVAVTALAGSRLSCHREDPPDPRPAFAPLRELRTWYGALGGGAYARLDTVGPVITVDFDTLRFHYDGVDLWRQEVPSMRDPNGAGPEPVRLPAAAAARVREVWDEAIAGFPDTTFRLETPAAVAPGWRPSPPHDDRWYRVDLPFAWDDDLAVHVGLRGGPQGYRFIGVSVRYAATGLPVFEYDNRGPGRYRRKFDSGMIYATLYPTSLSVIDAPLGPDAYRPSYAGPSEVRYDLELDYEPYHDAVRRLRLEYDRSASSGRSTGGTPFPGLTIGPTRCDSDRRTTVEGVVRWTVPDDPASLARATRALATCSSVRLRADARTHVRLEPGARGCVDGSWDIVSLETATPTVLWHLPVSTCGVGASLPAHQVVLAPGTNVGALAVQFVGSVTLECPATPAPTLNEVTFDTRMRDSPALEWDCWPGWSPLR